MKKNTIIISSIIVFIFLALAGCSSKEPGITDYVVAIGEDPENIIKVKNVGVLVIDADYYTAEEIDQLKRNNVSEIYTYLNIGSIENFRDYYKQYEAYTLGEYDNWPNERWIDVSNSKWQEFIDDKVNELSQKGIDGFFVDNIDVYYLYPSDEIYQGIVDILLRIKKTDKKVIINGGECFVKKYIEDENIGPGLFGGINQESVYTKYNFETKEYTKNNEEEIYYYSEYLDMILQKGFRVYVLEYAKDPKIINEAYDFSIKRNYTCYISNNIELKYDS